MVLIKVNNPCDRCVNNKTCKKSKKCPKFSKYVDELEKLNTSESNSVPKEKIVMAIIRQNINEYSLIGDYDAELYCALALNLLHEVKDREINGQEYINEIVSILS